MAGRRPSRTERSKPPEDAAPAGCARGPGAVPATGPVPSTEPHGGWLIKTEPTDYSYATLEREGRVVWDGVANPLARIHLWAMRLGDPVLVYHTGTEKAVVGLARVARAPYPDPSATAAPSSDGRSGPVAVDLEPVRRASAPVPLAAIRAERACRDLGLVRIPRLSVMPVPQASFTVLARLAGLSSGERKVQ